MTTAWRQDIPAEFAACLRFDEPLSRHTSWHVGGPADVYFTPDSAETLSRFLSVLPVSVPVYWLGLGSNVLIRDGGIRGVVIAPHPGLDRLERVTDTRVHADAGVPCARVARQCVKWAVGPAEFFAGIPGTIGGALAMNAGAWGYETWPQVVEVDVVNRAGTRRTRLAHEYHFGYRSLQAPVEMEWFVAARFEFSALPDHAAENIGAMLQRRRETQPIGAWSGGSTFTNPSNAHAARLIESTGLKGFRIGGAVVSEKHANFLINEGAATAADLEQLMDHVVREVERQHGIHLTPEVRVVGEHG
jgi:UDP-N-acetylmuramate dehydrogenase